jgi:hypothetical protein
MHHRWGNDLENARQTRDVGWRVLAGIGGGYTMVQSDVLEHTRNPTVFGESFVSTVVAIGECITRCKVGDRVLAVADPDPSHITSKGTFQHCTVTLPPLCSRTSASSRAVICPLPYTLLVLGSLARATYALSYLTSQLAREIDVGKLLYDWEKIEVSPNFGRWSRSDGGSWS